jgi:hypothetical protein
MLMRDPAHYRQTNPMMRHQVIALYITMPAGTIVTDINATVLTVQA